MRGDSSGGCGRKDFTSNPNHLFRIDQIIPPSGISNSDSGLHSLATRGVCGKRVELLLSNSPSPKTLSKLREDRSDPNSSDPNILLRFNLS